LHLGINNQLDKNLVSSRGYAEGQTVKERIPIYTEEDLDGDPLVEGTVREYSFAIYDEVRG
jgi:hypothetical protein